MNKVLELIVKLLFMRVLFLVAGIKWKIAKIFKNRTWLGLTISGLHHIGQYAMSHKSECQHQDIFAENF